MSGRPVVGPAWIHPGTRAVFFDAVGTLLFPEPAAPEVYAWVAAAQGVVAPAEDVRGRFLTAFRAEEEADRAAGWVTSDAREEDRWRRIVRAALPDLPAPDDAFHQLYEHFARPEAWRVEPEAVRVFSTLRGRGVKLGLASNYDRRLYRVVEGLPVLAPLRAAVVVSSVVQFRKPAREFFQAVVGVAGCAPAEVVFVGDDPENDYAGATAAGLEPVLLDDRWRYDHAPRRIRTLGELIG